MNASHLDYYTAQRARIRARQAKNVRFVILTIVLLAIFITLSALTTEPIELQQQQEVQAIVQATAYTDSTLLNEGTLVTTQYGTRYIACNNYNINADDVEMYPECILKAINN